MTYLKLETCQLLDKLGCTCESGMVRVLQVPVNRWTMMTRKEVLTAYVNAFTWDDICTKENAVKIWGEDDFQREVSCDAGVYEYETMPAFHWNVTFLLWMKLEGSDWEAELLKHLRTI